MFEMSLFFGFCGGVYRVAHDLAFYASSSSCAVLLSGFLKLLYRRLLLAVPNRCLSICLFLSFSLTIDDILLRLKLLLLHLHLLLLLILSFLLGLLCHKQILKLKEHRIAW